MIGVFAVACYPATIYNPGAAPSCLTCVVGNHLVSPDPHPSAAGVGGAGFNKPAGSALDGSRTYTYDLGGATDLADGIANRGDAGFAMLIWDMGVPLNTMRLYTHQDHYSGGPITTDFVAQDVMEYSVWGSTDGDNFVLLSDVTAYSINGGGAGLPTYTFAGTAPEIVFRGGSAEFGVLNAYTRDYVFPASYRYYGVRSSSVSLNFPGGPDADPELDAVYGNRGSIVNPGPGVPEPALGFPLLAAMGAGLWLRSRRRAA
jgi:hypothetical protein